MISVLHRYRRRCKHCCQHQSRKFRSTKTFHIVQNGLNILTSNHLARTLYQTYRKKNQTEHPFTHFLWFMTLRPAHTYPNHFISQNIWKKCIPLPAFLHMAQNLFTMLSKLHLEKNLVLCYTLYSFPFLPTLGTQRSEYFWRTKEIFLGRSLKILDGAEKAEEWAKLRVVMSNRWMHCEGGRQRTFCDGRYGFLGWFLPFSFFDVFDVLLDYIGWR